MPAVALQEKSPRLARPLARGLNLQLNPVARSSRQNTLFGKNWIFTFLLTLLYIYPYTHDFERISRENFEKETLEKIRLIHPQSSYRDSSNSFTLFLSIIISLRGTLPKLFLTIPIFVRRPFGVWKAVKKGPISYW